MQKNTTYIVHGAFILASLIYFFLYAFVLNAPETETNWLIAWIFVGISAFSVLLSLILPFVIGKLLSGFQKAQTMTIISGAFLESIGVYGLVGNFIGMPPVIAYSLMGASTLFLILNTFRVIRWTNEA